MSSKLIEKEKQFLVNFIATEIQLKLTHFYFIRKKFKRH